ncbi:MAG TPA: sensor histidine kinase [Solirubrobacteraceae bacterium]|nr:sensor histidine kinase [Solirubrobacteraceae bacterium]
MTGLRRALGLVAIEGIIVGLVALAIMLSSDHVGSPAATAVLGLFLGWSFIGAGLFAWWRRPDNRFGVLMTAVGFAFFLGSLTAADGSWLFTIGVLVSNLYLAVFVHMLLAYPDGRVDSPRLRKVLAVGYGLSIVGPLPTLMLANLEAEGCEDCPPSAISVGEHDVLFTIFDVLTSAIAVVLVGYILYVLVQRWQAATQSQRRAMSPVLGSGICLLVVLAGQLTTMAVNGPDALESAAGLLGLVFFALTPYGFLFGLLRSRVVQAGAVSELLRKLGDASDGTRLRELLSKALDDRSLQVVYWLEDTGRWVDAGGRPAGLPDEDDPARAWTAVEREGRRVGAIVHDRTLCDDAELMRSVAVAAGFSIENERLQAQLRARVEELRRSRARIVEAGTAERRRLERNLHDGAQQRLVALSLTLRLAQGKLRKDPDAAEQLLTGAQDELGRALEELRELARGIHPAVLSDRGLKAAIEALAGRSPVPVALERTPPERLPPPVEAAAYFVVAEALTNVVKYANASQARVSVSRSNGHAVVEVADDGVGGADPGRGSGLRGLADRISALDGTMVLMSPEGAGTLLRAEIPV